MTLTSPYGTQSVLAEPHANTPVIQLSGSTSVHQIGIILPSSSTSLSFSLHLHSYPTSSSSAIYIRPQGLQILVQRYRSTHSKVLWSRHRLLMVAPTSPTATASVAPSPMLLSPVPVSSLFVLELFRYLSSLLPSSSYFSPTNTSPLVSIACTSELIFPPLFFLFPSPLLLLLLASMLLLIIAVII